MPSANDENDAASVAKAYQDLVKKKKGKGQYWKNANVELKIRTILTEATLTYRAERTASELESRLDTLDARLEDLLKLIPPELLNSDNGMFKQNAEKLFGNGDDKKLDEEQIGAKKE